jgi:metal-responsive CopG/Arc/MetJ family transcriptional regulator
MGQAAPVAKKYRVQLDFPEEGFRELNSLVDKLRASSRAEVVRDALSVLKWLYRKKVEQGCQVVAIDSNDRVFEPEFPFLPDHK